MVAFTELIVNRALFYVLLASFLPIHVAQRSYPLPSKLKLFKSVIHFVVSKYENLDFSGFAFGVQIIIFTSNSCVYNLH